MPTIVLISSTLVQGPWAVGSGSRSLYPLSHPNLSGKKVKYLPILLRSLLFSRELNEDLYLVKSPDL